MDKIVIWGATGQAVVLQELLSYTEMEIVALFDNNDKAKSPFADIPLFYKVDGFKKWLTTITNVSDYYFLVAIGGNKGSIRQEISTLLSGAGLKKYTAIHKTAYIASNAKIGSGCQILAHSTICAKVSIGDNCIINSSANIDHECILSNNVHIGPGAVLTGCIEVGENTFIGANATILPKLTIGSNVTIGAGAVILSNVENNLTIVGNPGRKMSISKA